MATLANTNSKAGVGYCGKEVAITTLSKTNMTQAELDAAIRFIGLTASIVGIGDDTAGGFNTGVSDVVHVLSEGIAPAAGANFGVGSTGITAAVVACHFS